MSDTNNTSGIIAISADAPAFPITASALEATRTRCLALKVNGVADVEGFKIADRARMDVKADRCAVQNRQKELKKQIKDWQEKHVDAPAKHLIDELEKIEKYLESQTEPVKVEKERLAAEAKAKKEREDAEKLATRVAALVECRAVKNPLEVAAMSDADFAAMLAECQRADQVRREQEAEEQRKRNAEKAELEELRKLKPVAAEPKPAAANAADHPSLDQSPATPFPPRPPRPDFITPPVAATPRVEQPAKGVDDLLDSIQALLDYADHLEAHRVPDVCEQLKHIRSLCVGIVADAAIEIRKLVETERAKIETTTSDTVGGIDIDDI